MRGVAAGVHLVDRERHRVGAIGAALHLSEEERDHIYSLLDKIAEEYERNIDTHTQEIIIGSISMLLKYAQRYYDRQFFTRKNVNQDVLGRFEKLLQNMHNEIERNMILMGCKNLKDLDYSRLIFRR